MSQQLDSTQYQIQINADQTSGGVFQVQLDLTAEADFGDTQAVAMFNTILGAVPSAWSPSSSLSKSVSTDTIYAWNESAGAFE